MSAGSNSNRPAGRPRDIGDVLDEAEMDETLDETFPASDPPSWTLGVDDESARASDRGRGCGPGAETEGVRRDAVP